MTSVEHARCEKNIEQQLLTNRYFETKTDLPMKRKIKERERERE